MQTLVLVGSGEFTSSMNITDKFLIDKRKKELKKKLINIAIIPTASVPDGRQENWIKDGVKHFQKLGANPFGLNIVNRKDADKSALLKKLKTADFIYFSGGHPGFLLETFKNTKAWKLINDLYEKGVILAGSSAGAMIMGSYLLANAQETFDNGIKPRWTKGFNLVPYTIFPHFDWVQKNKPELFKKVLDSSPKFVRESWMGIDEDTSLIIFAKKKVKIRGKGRVTIQKGNKLVRYKSSQEFLI